MIIKEYKKAVKLLLEDNIVALPTETVYGLAARADNDLAVAKIYNLKQRPIDHPLIVHVAKNWDLNNWIMPYPSYVEILIKIFWPGPLTLVFDFKPGSISNMVNAGLKTIAIRCPDHPLMQKILAEIQLPLAAPSANPYGKVSPTSAEHVKQSFRDHDLYILDGGDSQVGIESTILLVTAEDKATILRPGAILASDLAKVIPKIEILQPEKYDFAISGNKLTHYQPNKTLYLAENSEVLLNYFDFLDRDAIVWLFDKVEVDFEINYLTTDPKMLAKNLYNILHISDKAVPNNIVMQLPPNEPKWVPIRERLLKAGQLL